MNIEKMVLEEIQKRLEELSELDPASEEYKAVEDATLKLIDRAAKMEELTIQSMEHELKQKQMDDERKERKWDRGIRLASVITPPTIALIAACIFSVVERTEIVSNTAPREFIRRALRLS